MVCPLLRQLVLARHLQMHAIIFEPLSLKLKHSGPTTNRLQSTAQDKVPAFHLDFVVSPIRIYSMFTHLCPLAQPTMILLKAQQPLSRGDNSLEDKAWNHSDEFVQRCHRQN